MKKIAADLLKILSLLALTLLISFTVYLHMPFVFSHKPTCIYIQKNESFNLVLSDITKRTQRISPFILKLYSKFKKIDRHIQAGEYCFTSSDSIFTMMESIAHGNRIRHKFTIVDGWNYSELINHLANAPSLSGKLLLNNQAELATALASPTKQLEGQFFPETYYYAYPDTAVDLLEQAQRLMMKKVNFYYQQAGENTYYKNPYELLIVASIIEKESHISDDQQLISSVIFNRLKKNMKLQMDPTVIYGLNDNHHKPLTRQNLKNDTVYNTYLHLGLPPTPICMPSEAALFAAAHPKNSDYYFYVAKGDGYHQFSETLSQQDLAIKKYLLHQIIEEPAHEHTT